MKIVRTNTFQNIPRVLFEDSADEFLKGNAIDRLYFYDESINNNPYNMVFEFQEDEKIVGVLWLIVSPVFNALISKFVSVLPNYRGDISGRIDDFMTKLAQELELNCVFGATQKDSSYWQSYGWELANTRIIVKEV